MRIFVVRQLRQVTVGPRRQTHTTDLRLHSGTRQLCMFYHSHDDCDGECCCCYNYTRTHTHTHSVKALKVITVTLSDMSICIYVCTALYHLSKKSACTYPAYFYILQSGGWVVPPCWSSGDAACDADWVPLTEDNRLTTIESSIFRT